MPKTDRIWLQCQQPWHNISEVERPKNGSYSLEISIDFNLLCNVKSKDGTSKKVPCPTALIEYNKNRYFVDEFDQLLRNRYIRLFSLLRQKNVRRRTIDENPNKRSRVSEEIRFESPWHQNFLEEMCPKLHKSQTNANWLGVQYLWFPKFHF